MMQDKLTKGRDWEAVAVKALSKVCQPSLLSIIPLMKTAADDLVHAAQPSS